jgi:hypothetical protein
MGSSLSAQAAKIQNQVLSFFNNSLKVTINGETTSSTANFTADVTEAANGNPYPAITSQWLTANLEMVGMDMGITKVKATDIKPGQIKFQASLSMSGQWKMNLKMTTSAGSEVRSFTFKAP